MAVMQKFYDSGLDGTNYWKKARSISCRDVF